MAGTSEATTSPSPNMARGRSFQLAAVKPKPPGPSNSGVSSATMVWPLQGSSINAPPIQRTAKVSAMPSAHASKKGRRGQAKCSGVSGEGVAGVGEGVDNEEGVVNWQPASDCL